MFPASISKTISALILAGFISLFPQSLTASESQDSGNEQNELQSNTISNNGSAESHVRSNFAWGVDVGSSIDMSGYDLSTFDVNLMMGYKNSLFRIIGIGAGINRAFGNGSTFIPLYFVVRTSFRKRPSLLFMHLKAGYSLNTIRESATQGDIKVSLGLGINLAVSHKFMSHIILSCGVRHFSDKHLEALDFSVENIYLAQLSFGINF